MSIILDALKKVDSIKEKQDNTPSQAGEGASGVFVSKKNTKQKRTASNPVRVVLLFCLFVLISGVVFYYGKDTFLKHLFVNASVPQINQALSVQKQSFNVRVNKENQENVSENEDEEEISRLRKTAVLNFKKSNYEESLAAYKKLIKLLPADAEIYNNYGLVLKRLGRNKEALVAYETALALQSKYPEVLNNMAVIYMTEGNYNVARRHLEQAIELDSEYVDPHLHLALCLEKLGDFETAIHYYESFLDLSTNKVDRKIRVQVEGRISRLKEDL